MSDDPAIHLVRPLFIEYETVGHILKYEKSVYTMPEDLFVGYCMYYSHGAMSPSKAREIHKQLMKEAGL